MKHIGLFEGIGGFSLAARWMGWDTIAWCEIDNFCQIILKYHFPNAQAHNDIRATDFTIYRGKCDILTGGFPCQPYSVAGKRKGTDDKRHLWPEMLRAIREIEPTYVVGENVGGLISWDGGMVFEQVHIDMENAGYQVQAFVLPACAVNAPHRRDRVWFIAKNTVQDGWRSDKRQSQSGERKQWNFGAGNNVSICADNAEVTSDTESKRGAGYSIREAQESTKHGGISRNGITSNAKGNGDCGKLRKMERANDMQREPKEHREDYTKFRDISVPILRWTNFPTQSPICSGNDGLPTELDGITISKHRRESIKAYGNAIVPQVALQIFKALLQTEWQLQKDYPKYSKTSKL